MPVLYPDFFFFLQSILIGYLTGWLYFNSCSEKTNSYLAFYLSCLIVTACFSEGNIRVLWQRKMEKYISYLLTDYKVTLELCSMCYNLLCTKAYFDTSSIPVFCDPLSKLSFWHCSEPQLHSERPLAYNMLLLLGLIKNNFPLFTR